MCPGHAPHQFLFLSAALLFDSTARQPGFFAFAAFLRATVGDGLATLLIFGPVSAAKALLGGQVAALPRSWLLMVRSLTV